MYLPTAVLVVVATLVLRFADCMTAGLNTLSMPSPIAATKLGREIVTTSIPGQLSKRNGPSSDIRQKFEKVVRNAQVSAHMLQ